MNNFSLAFLTISDVGPVEAVKIAAQAGYDKVGLRLLPATPEEDNYPLLVDDKLLREVQAAIEDSGIGIGDVELVRLRSESDLNSFIPFFERAAQLGAENIIVVGDEPEKDRLTELFASLCELSAPFNLVMNLEPIPWTALHNLETAIEIIKNANQKNSSLLVDAFHFYRESTSLELLEMIDPDQLRLFQICDAPRAFVNTPQAICQEARTARLYPGEGELKLSELLRFIPDSATISVEVPNSLYRESFSPLERAQMALEATQRIINKDPLSIR